MYKAIVNFDNGTSYSETFDNYDEMCDWLALYPEGGISAYLENDTNDAVDQRELQTDVQARQ